MYRVNEISLNELKKELSSLTQQDAFGTSPFQWLNWVYEKSHNNLLKNSLPLLSKNKIRREDIYGMVTSNKLETITCVASILSWGGMRRGSGVSALSTVTSWLPVCDEIRSGKLSRSEAYEKFMSIRLANKMKGMGPAFFTKLIFFFMYGQKSQGYIMDQWTGTSVNLLSESELVKLKKVKTLSSYYERVSDDNTFQDYENFCLYIERIASDLGRDPVQVELGMFSEGRGNGGWRNYVVQSRAS